MSIFTRPISGWDEELIWPLETDQLATTQVVGPGRAIITVIDEPELAPFDLELYVSLVVGRYVVTHLRCHANVVADVKDLGVRFGREPSEENLFTPSVQVAPITATGLSDVRLPSIISSGLSGKAKARRQMADGTWVTGIGAEDELPVVYVVAQATGDNPTQAVARHFKISSSVAAQRVARARKAGRLPAATRGAR